MEINKEELHKYITGLVNNRKAKMLAVHCMPDHTHLLWMGIHERSDQLLASRFFRKPDQVKTSSPATLSTQTRCASGTCW